MPRLLDAVVALCEQEGWPFDVDSHVVRVAAAGPDGPVPVVVVAAEEPGYVVAYTLLEDHVPAAATASVMEALTRANPRIAVGNLEMDLDSGQVRYRTSLPVGDGDPSALVRRSIIDNVVSATAWFEVVERVARGEVTARDAVDRMAGAG